MKCKMIAAILALTVMCWAQTATQTAPAPQQNTTSAETARCPCSDKMSCHKTDAKDTRDCCAHHGMKAEDNKDMASCGKDTKSCMKDEKMASSCKGCCAKDKTTAACSNHGDN